MFFSIIIPTYNRADFIGKTIHSLLLQQYTDFEILVIDDGSKDNTEEVISEVKDPRLHYYKKENAERGAARNYGARLAKGIYLNFFDSDDLAYDNHLKAALAAIKALESPEVIHLAYDIKNNQGKLLHKADRFPATINDMLINGNHLSCNGVFIRKDIAEKFPFSETRALSASEDYALWLRLAAHFPIYCINEITTTVINHDYRSVLQINKEQFLKRIELLLDELMKDKGFMAAYERKIPIFRAYLNIYTALHLAMAGNQKRENFLYLVNAVKYKPRVLFTRRFIAALKNVLL